MTKWKKERMGRVGDTVYGMGLIGALFYFIPQATSFGMGVVAVLKAIVWPALVVFHLLQFLKI